MDQDKYKAGGEISDNPTDSGNAPEDNDTFETAENDSAPEKKIYVDSDGAIRDPGAGQPEGWVEGNPPPLDTGLGALTPGKLAIIGIFGILAIASIIVLFVQYLGVSQGVSCGTKRRDIENAYFQSTGGYGVVSFEEFLDANFADRSGSCPSGKELRYYWDEEKQCVACSKHDNPVYPITSEPADGANLRMLYESFIVFGKLNTLPPRDEEGALVWSDIWGEDEEKADFWRRYYDWIDAKDFNPEKVDGLRIFYAKGPDGSYMDEVVGVSYERGSFKRVYFADGTLKNASYEEFISDGQLRKGE
jgi:hypothetical protein